jgi:hypothetical protein
VSPASDSLYKCDFESRVPCQGHQVWQVSLSLPHSCSLQIGDFHTPCLSDTSSMPCSEHPQGSGPSMRPQLCALYSHMCSLNILKCVPSTPLNKHPQHHQQGFKCTLKCMPMAPSNVCPQCHQQASNVPSILRTDFVYWVLQGICMRMCKHGSKPTKIKSLPRKMHGHTICRTKLV